MNGEIFRNNMMAAGAQLRSAFGGFFPDLTTSFFRLEVKYAEEPEPGHISHRPIESSSAIPRVHTFNENGVVVPDQPVGSLKMKVTTLIKYLLMGLGHQDPGLLSTSRAFNPAREPLLPHRKLGLGFLEKSRVANLDVIRSGEERIAAHVNAHRLPSRGQRLICHIIAGEDNKPLVGSAPAHGDSLNIALDRAGEPYLESSYVADSEVLAIEIPAGLLQSEAVIAVPTLESWKAWFISVLNSAKERLVGLIKAFNHFLEALRTNSLILRESLFEAGEFLYLVVSGDRLVIVSVGCNPLLKSCVVETSAEVKPGNSVLDGLSVRLNAIFEGLLHLPCSMFNVPYTEKGVKPFRASLSVSPALKSGVLDSGNL